MGGAATRWRNRFGIGKSARLFGEAGDVNLSEVKLLMQDFRLKLVSFNPENIFNMDETGLFFIVHCRLEVER